jgi:hypothetical protein
MMLTIYLIKFEAFASEPIELFIIIERGHFMCLNSFVSFFSLKLLSIAIEYD